MAALDRRKVTMTSAVATPQGVQIHQAEDFVDVLHLDAYIADARSRWQSVVAGEDTDHGPAGEDGHYDVHAALNAPAVPAGHPSHPETNR